MQTFWQDLRYGARMLMKQPGFTLIAVITLALGIGANTAIFSVVNAVLLRPLPYRDAGRIVAIQELGPQGNRIQVTSANFLDWRAQNTVFAHLAAILSRQSNLANDGQAERIETAITSANFFEVFGEQPQAGRLFAPADEQAGHAPVVVLSHRLWLRRFGGEANAVGQKLILDGKSYTVIGVAPAGFQYPDKTELWFPPLRLAPEFNETFDVTQTRGFGTLSAVARLKPAVSLEQAKSEMETITARLRKQYPETNNNRFNRVVPLQTSLVGETSRLLWLLFGAVGCVLLIACANVANLLLARPTNFPRLGEITLDLPALGFALLASLATAIIFGLAPAWQGAQIGLQEALKDSSRGSVGARRNRLRGALVTAEVTLSLSLLVGAGLLFRSFLRLQAVDTGFDAGGVLTMRLAPSGTNCREDPQYIGFYQQVAEKIATIPGVEAVGAINTLPLSKGRTFHFRVEGQPEKPEDQWPGANYRNVTPDYFRAMKIPIMQGRSFTERDNESAPPVVIINQAAAAREFAGQNPVGKRVTFGGRDRSGQPIWHEIVGVAANVRSMELQDEAEPEIYTAARQDAFAGMTFVIRASVEPASLATAVRQAAREVDPAQPVSDLRTMESVVVEAVTQPRFNLTLLGLFGGLALLLSAAGIYGVTSYSVAQRAPEIGIRKALGAQSGDVLRLVIRQAMAAVLPGVVIGLAIALASTRVMKSLLFGVSATDPLTFVAIALSLTLVALLACWIPARRATKVDPMVALRTE